MEAEELEPPPVRCPDLGPGQPEVGVEDAGAMELHQADDAGVGGGVEEVGGEGLRAGQQCNLDRGKEVGRVERHSFQFRRVLARVLASAGQVPERR